MVLVALYALAAAVLAVVVFAATRSTLRAALVTGVAVAAVLLGGFVAAWLGYRDATAALLGASPSARVLAEPAFLDAPLAAGEDATARAWGAWLDGHLRVEPEPAFLTGLRWAARLAPEASLEMIRELSPHEPSV